MICPFCQIVPMICNKESDGEDLNGNQTTEYYYECPKCETKMTVSRKK